MNRAVRDGSEGSVGSVHNDGNTRSAGGGGSTPPQKIRRRNRMITSCLECRRRKLKCDKSRPCLNCSKFHRDCVFLAPALDQASQLRLTEIKEKVGSLERQLERDVANSSSSSRRSNSSPSQERIKVEEHDDYFPANEDERDLYPTPMAIPDAAFCEDGDDDDLLDLGVRLGKMRINERIGGFFRPRISEELEYNILRLDRMAMREETQRTTPPPLHVPLPPAEEWLKPTSDFINPSPNFPFGPGSHCGSLTDYLPSRLGADRLVRQYFECVHPVCQVVHRPTFEKEYEAFWTEVAIGVEPPAPIQVVVFASLFSAVVSMEEDTVARDFGVTRESLLENFKQGTESALASANFLRSTKVRTLQGFVMYLIPLCRAEVTRAHAVLVSAAIKMAEISGLNKDGEAYGLNPIETHIRRLIWHQLCFLDIRTCEAQGPRPTIRHDEFDTKLPVNANDTDLLADGPPPPSQDQYTDTTLSLIRFEINEMMRTLWFDRPRVEMRKTSITAVLTKIETFKTKMAAKYDHLLDERIPIQRAAREIKAVLVSRLHVMLLSRYHVSVSSPMPDRLCNIMISSGVGIIEAAVRLDTTPEIRPWSWYAGAFNQYHIAFLLLVEVYGYQNRTGYEARIWRSLDYVFDSEPLEPLRHKARRLLCEIQQKTAIFQSMRGMRAPTRMYRHLGSRSTRQAVDRSQKEENLRYLSSPNASYGRSSSIASTNTPSPPPAEQEPYLGRVPMDMQITGRNEGQAVWALAGQQSLDRGYESASSSSSMQFGAEGRNLSTQMTMPMPHSQVQDLMSDIDWVALDALFPPNQVNDMNVQGFQQNPPSDGQYY